MKIVVLILRGFHLGYLGCYGNSWIDTPHLDSLASEGVVFDHHYADCPSPAGSRRAWFTGRYHFPSLEHKPALPLSDTHDLLSTLRGSNIPSILVSDSEILSGNDAEKWHEKIPYSLNETKNDFSKIVGKTVMQAIRKLKPHDRGLIWVESNFLNPPWTVDESETNYFAESADDESSEGLIEPLKNPAIGWVDRSDDLMIARLQRTYASAVSQLDNGMGALMEELQGREQDNALMLVMTTDLGFPLGEHGLVGNYRPWLHEELVHIPLIIRLPGGISAGTRIRALTQPVDLMPTLLGALGLNVPKVDGASLLPLIRGDQERIREFACSGLRIGNALELSLRTHDWAFLAPIFPEENDPPRDRQLYVKPDDRWEVNNVLQHHPDLVENLEKMLNAFMQSHS